MPDSEMPEPDAPDGGKDAASPGARGPDFAAPAVINESVSGTGAGNVPPPVDGSWSSGEPSRPAGSPTGEPASHARPSRLPLLIMAIVAAVVIIGVGATVVIMTTVNANRPMPEDTARAFVEAAYRNDCDAVRKTIADEFWNGAGLTCLDVSFHGTDFADTTVADWAFTDSVINGEIATITLDPPGDVPSTGLRMRLVDGTWKITNWQF